MKKTLLSAILSLSLIITFIFAPCQASAESIHSMSADELEAYIAYLQIVLQNKRKEEGNAYIPSAAQPTVAPAKEQHNIIFNGRIYTGTYDGDLQDGKPHGSGTFEGYYQKNKLTYSGQWLNGEMSGIGTVEADSYMLHFDITEGVYDRVGSYVGDVVNGLPEGDGTFKTEVGASNPWKYTGEWKAGMFNGQGKQTWENESTVKEGTFTNNEFTPTATDAFLYTAHKKDYDITSKSMTAISAYSAYFTGIQQNTLPDEAFIDTAFDLKLYKKRPNDYGDKLIYVSKAKVFQVLTWEIGDKTVEQILMETDDDDIYYGFYYGKSNIVEDMEISAYVLPFDWDTYKNVNDNDVWAVFCAITDCAGDKKTFNPRKSKANSSADNSVVIVWGTYEQDNNLHNGKEPIEWFVLAKDGNRALVVSKYALDSRAYNQKLTNITWEKSTLRNWLNKEFIDIAFSTEERKSIIETTVPADMNPGFMTYPGSATKDKIFLLSSEEANAYFSSAALRVCQPTQYALEHGVASSRGSGCWWYLRTPGKNQQRVSFVGITGSVDKTGSSVDLNGYAIRPAMWIDLDTANIEINEEIPQGLKTMSDPVHEFSYTPMKQGDTGNDVFSMKERLQVLGYFSEGATLSDKYNSTTAERVKLFQKANGLKQTGIANEETLQLLYSENAKRNPY